MKSFIAAAGLVAVAQAFTQPVQPPSYGALLTPNTDSPVTTGQTYQITWDPTPPTDGVTVSLVLCNGPGANCVLQNSAIVEGVPASQGSYSWSVPCGLPAGVASTETGYGMLIIVDGTGQFQYSTQFSVNTGSSCGSSDTTTTTTSSSSSSSSSPSAPTTTASGSVPSGPPSILSTTGSGWYGWSSSSFNTSTVAAPTGSGYSTPAAVTTTQASASYTPSGTVSAPPQQFTGAAALPTAFVNAAGLIGAAAFAVMAF